MIQVVILVVAVALGALGYHLGQKKDRAIEGLLLGGLLGLIGLLILACLKPKQPAVQNWGGAGYGVQTYGQPAQQAYGQQAYGQQYGQPVYGYGQPNVLPAGAAGPAIPANPYAPVAETAGYGFQQPVPVPQPAVAPAPVSAQWFADPSGRHQHRWWDGNAWTEHVADNGVASVDAPQPVQPS